MNILFLVTTSFFIHTNCNYVSIFLDHSSDLNDYTYIKHCILSNYDYRVDDNFNDSLFIWYYTTKFNLTKSVQSFNTRYNIRSCISNQPYANDTNLLINNSFDHSIQNDCFYTYFFLSVSVFCLILICVYALIKFKLNLYD